MVAMATYGETLKICVLCLIWYSLSSANNVIGKVILSDFPYPMTLSMVQLISISVYTVPLLMIWSIPGAARIPLKYWFQMILPLAFGKFFSTVSSHISIWKVPISYAHTVKATMPLFTVFFSTVILRERQTLKVYLSLLPIIGGVIIATLTELSFDALGLASAIAATVGFSLQNIFSKKCLKDTGIHHLRLLFVLALISAVCFAPLWTIYDGTRIWKDSGLLQSSHLPRLLGLLIIDGALSWGQNLVAFTVIALISPLSYAVANATKRISIISVSLVTLRNPVTSMNVFGMFVAVIGVLMYNKAKLDQKKQEKMLPFTLANGSLGHKVPGYPPNGHVNPLLMQNGYGPGFFEDKVYFQTNSPPLSSHPGSNGQAGGYGRRWMSGDGNQISVTRWV